MSDPERTQCDPSTPCAAGNQCEGGYCIAGAWSCLSASAPIPFERRRISLRFVDPESARPVPGSIRLCFSGDPECAEPRFTTETDAEGAALVEVESEFVGAKPSLRFEPALETYPPHLFASFWAPIPAPGSAEEDVIPIAIRGRSTLPRLDPPDATRGTLLVRARRCDGSADGLRYLYSAGLRDARSQLLLLRGEQAFEVTAFRETSEDQSIGVLLGALPGTGVVEVRDASMDLRLEAIAPVLAGVVTVVHVDAESH